MGLFSFFLKSPQKSEDKGDADFEAGKFGPAKLAYETALDLLEKKDPEDSAANERLVEKLRKSREALALEHLRTGDSLIEADVPDEAENLFSIALSLTENSELKARLEKRLVSSGFEISEDRWAETEDTQEKSDHHASDHHDMGDDNREHEFEVLCATMPEEMAEAYRSYGETFKEGYLALSQGDFARAVEKLEQAMEEAPSWDLFIPVEFATALIHNGQSERAIEVLTRNVQDNPGSIHGISLLCDLLCEFKQFETAHDVIDQAPQKIRQSQGCRFHKGRIYYLQGDYQEAETIYKKALDSGGWQEDIARELAGTLDAAGKKEEALSLYADILNKCSGCGQRPNPLDKKAFADISFEMKDFSDKTLKLYLDLANEYPEIASECFDKVSLIYLKSGNEKEAKRFQQLAGGCG